MATKLYEIEDLQAHFPNEITDDVVDYASDTVFLSSRYIFTHREGKQQYGYCTHCNTEFETKGLRHKKQAICPNCNSKCTVVASGYGRSTMIDEKYFVYYDKSLIDKNAIVARGIYAIRDYRGNYKSVETQFKIVSMYVFKLGISMAIRRSVYYHENYGICKVGRWEKCASIYSEASKDHYSYIDSYCSNWSIKKSSTEYAICLEWVQAISKRKAL